MKLSGSKGESLTTHRFLFSPYPVASNFTQENAEEILENRAQARIILIRSMPRCIGQASKQVSLGLAPV